MAVELTQLIVCLVSLVFMGVSLDFAIEEYTNSKR